MTAGRSENRFEPDMPIAFTIWNASPTDTTLNPGTPSNAETALDTNIGGSSSSRCHTTAGGQTARAGR